jgi:FMN phosphatase YigB (HAD superfamily)
MNKDISFVVLSYDVGYEKPDHRMWDAATHMLKETLVEDSADVKAQSIDDFDMLYVGDDVQKDVSGAAQAGWNAVLVDRNATYAEHLPDEMSIGYIPIQLMDDPDREKQIHVINDLHALSSWPPS